MSNLLEQIKKQQKMCRLNYQKTKDPAEKIRGSILTTLIGEIQTNVLSSGNFTGTDADVVSTIKKFMSNISDTIALDESNNDLRIELDTLNSFLPKQLSEEELEHQVVLIKDEFGYNSQKDMGKIMGELKQRFPGQYDGSVASRVVKAALNG